MVSLIYIVIHSYIIFLYINYYLNLIMIKSYNTKFFALKMKVIFKKKKNLKLSYTTWYSFHSIQNGYKGLRPWIILISITIIATTSNIWIKLPTIPSENPKSQRINRITTIVQNRSINLTSSLITYVPSAINIFAL